ncbi:DUF6056 family protein [Streptomyces sp. NPDC088551]|uniref:DUF6056 family protein n=1 Tax=Streptomyces sp. NPDC088551 TaxID=3365863 RepID=UPI0038146322
MAAGASRVIIPEQPGGRPRRRRENGRGSSVLSVRAWPGYGVLGLLSLPLGLLGSAFWLGRHVRPSADEWCFLPSVRDHGITGLVGKFYLTDNGRLGNGLLVGAYAKYGVAGHQWFGLVSGVVMLGLLWAVTVLLLRLTGRTAPRGVPLFVASMVTVVFLFASLNTYKTFYWPASSVSHTVAPVLACAAAVPLLWAGSRRGRVAAGACALVMGAFLGTLSEETSVVALVVLLTLLLLGHRILVPRARAHARAWCLAGGAGIVIGTLLLLTSPGSRNRRARYDAGTGSMFAPESLAGSLDGFLDILGTLFTTWWYLGALAAGVVLALLTGKRKGHAPVLLPCRPLFLLGTGTVTFLVAGYVCTVITYPLFGPHVVFAHRTWNDYLLLYVVLLVGAGALLGRALRGRALRGHATRGRASRTCAVATAAGAAMCVAVCIGLAFPLGELGESMRVRAEKWDHQDHWLRERAARGARVLPYKPLSVSGMGEPFAHRGGKTWPARCVADYYHLERITRAERLP